MLKQIFKNVLFLDMITQPLLVNGNTTHKHLNCSTTARPLFKVDLIWQSFYLGLGLKQIIDRLDV